MTQELQIEEQEQNLDDLLAEESATLQAEAAEEEKLGDTSDMDEEEPAQEEPAAPVVTPEGETTPAPKSDKRKLMLGLGKWKMRRKRGRDKDKELLPLVESLREQAKVIGYVGIAEELFHNALSIVRGINFGKQSMQNVPLTHFWQHQEEQEQKEYDFQTHFTVYVDSSARQVLYCIEQIRNKGLQPTVELLEFAIMALTKGLVWMRRNPAGCDGVAEIENDLKRLIRTKPSKPRQPWTRH